MMDLIIEQLKKAGVEYEKTANFVKIDSMIFISNRDDTKCLMRTASNLFKLEMEIDSVTVVGYDNDAFIDMQGVNPCDKFSCFVSKKLKTK